MSFLCQLLYSARDFAFTDEFLDRINAIPIIGFTEELCDMVKYINSEAFALEIRRMKVAFIAYELYSSHSPRMTPPEAFAHLFGNPLPETVVLTKVGQARGLPCGGFIPMMTLNVYSCGDLSDHKLQVMARLMRTTYMNILFDLGYIGVGTPNVRVMVWSRSGIWQHCAIIAIWDDHSVQIVRWSTCDRYIVKKLIDMYPGSDVYIFESTLTLLHIRRPDMVTGGAIPDVIPEDFRFIGSGIECVCIPKRS